jgi:putative transposase
MEKFQNKYRIPSARMQNWDYGQNAAYFVTICTQNRECFFGDIIHGEMQVSEFGSMANQYWLEIPGRFPFIQLDKFVIMPNHVHGIIVIDKPNDDDNDGDDGRDFRDVINRVSTGGFAGNKNPMLNNNLSRVIRWYKGRVSFETQEIHPGFDWQSRFHDHIIRNDKSYQQISEYIKKQSCKMAR